MKLEVNLSKKSFFILLGAILVLAGAIYGYAYGGSEPEVMGHSGGEIEVDDEFCNRITGQDCGAESFDNCLSTNQMTTNSYTTSLCSANDKLYGCWQYDYAGSYNANCGVLS